MKRSTAKEPVEPKDVEKYLLRDKVIRKQSRNKKLLAKLGIS